MKKKPKKVLWFFFEGNDLTKDLRYEKQNKILMNYLNGKDQKIIKRISFIDTYIKREIIEEVDLVDKKKKILFKQKKSNNRLENLENFLQNTKFLRLWAVRNLIHNAFNKDEIDPLFLDILDRTNKTIKQWGGELYFIYLPEKKRYSNKFNYHILKERFRNKGDVIDLVNSLDIKLIDTDKMVFRKVDDPLKLFDHHYNEKGYKKIVDVLVNIK